MVRDTSSGEWVLVTGASAGIGEAFAQQAAARGKNVVLVARRKDRLEALAAKLQQQYGIATLVQEADLSIPDGIQSVVSATESRGIVPLILFNNAGYGTSGAFLGNDIGRDLLMIDLNCRSLVSLAHAYGNQMSKRKVGTIVNVASVVGFLPSPYFAAYAATKAFVLSFSVALAEELRKEGVHVVALCPGATKTEFSEVAKMTASDGRKEPPFTESAEAVAKTAWNAIETKQIVAVSGFQNKVTTKLFSLIPRVPLSRLAAKALRPTSV